MSEKQTIPLQPGAEHSVYGQDLVNPHSGLPNSSITYDPLYQKQPYQEPITILVNNPKVLQRMKIYRACLFLTWVFTLAIYIIMGTQLYRTHNSANTPTHLPCIAVDVSPQINNNTTSTTSPDDLHASTTTGALVPRNTPDYECIAGFTHDQMVTGLNWMKKEYNAPERQWGAPCSMVANLKGKEILAEWQFRLS